MPSPPATPIIVASVPITKLSVIAIRAAVRTLAPNANTVACSRVRVSRLMAAVLNAISSANTRTAITMTWTMPSTYPNASRSASVIVVTD